MCCFIYIQIPGNLLRAFSLYLATGLTLADMNKASLRSAWPFVLILLFKISMSPFVYSPNLTLFNKSA